MADRLQFLRPSGAALWTACAAYLAACVGYAAPPETADEIRVREEGTACHWLAQQRFLTGTLLPSGTVAPNNVVIDDDMRSAVETYVATIYERCYPGLLHVEERVDCSVIYPGMEGSPDCWSYHAPVLRVFDLKYGYGFVDEFWNLQLTIYTLALGSVLGLPDDTIVEMSIFQPRAITNEGPFRTWKATLGELRREFLGMLQLRAVLAMAPNGVATSGMHCLDCPGRHECSTFINTAREVIRQVEKSVRMDLSPAALGAELRVVKDMVKLLESREESLKAQIEAKMRKGQPVPGWEFRPSKGREAYLPGMEKAFMGAAKLYGVDATRPITPGEARRQLPQIVVDAFVNRPKAGMALSYVSEKEVHKRMRK